MAAASTLPCMSDDQAHRASDSRAGTPVELLRSAAALMDGTDPRTARGINAGQAMPSTSQPRRSFSKTYVDRVGLLTQHGDG